MRFRFKVIIGLIIICCFSFLIFFCKSEVKEKKFLEDRDVIKYLSVNEITDEKDTQKIGYISIPEKDRRDSDFFELENLNELDKSIDFNSFLPSYNLLVTKALLEKCNTVDFYYKWFNIDENRKVEFDATCLFLNYCAYQSDLLNDVIPSTRNCVELENYFKNINSFYVGTQNCYPMIGDLILFDDNQDKIADRVGIISFISEFEITVIGLNQNCDKHSRLEVAEKNYSISDNRIYGYCRPNYKYIRLENFKDAGLPFNAVDTVVKLKEQEYADVLASKGIEVIARYINSDGRYPLTLEEVEMYSKSGIRVMMIYQVNKDDPYKGYDKGVELGTKALQYASDLKAPEGMPIFFCCDCNNRPESLNSVVDFIQGVKDSMQGKYGIGLYGGFYTCEAMYNLGLLDAYWQCWGYSDKYLSNNLDMIQYTGGIKFFDEIPYYFDANYVKYPEKVAYILDVGE